MKHIIHTAVILAAGENRNFPCPEGLLKLTDINVMDRILKILQKNGIDHIVMEKRSSIAGIMKTEI